MSAVSDEDSLEGKSWIEICDAERAQVEELDRTSCRISTLSNSEEEEISEDKDSSHNRSPDHTVNQFFKVKSATKPKFKTAPGTSRVKNKSSTVSKYECKDEVEGYTNSKSLSKLDPAVCQTPISYAKVVQGLKSESNGTPTKMETSNTDELSLTSHLDVFHVASPLKNPPKIEAENYIPIDENTVMFSPCKEEITVKNMKRPFQLIESPKPRPRSASDSSIRKIAKSVAHSDVHTASIEEIEEGVASGSEDGKDRDLASPNLKRELEVNPEILSRRQKQIDYGKNTLGYDRYTKVIPKIKRTKEHPKTPPKHLKMSRRAWDGLVKNWRLKLHNWDPISEKDENDIMNSNFDQYSFSSEEPSSYDSSSVRSDSAPSTPKAHSVTECEERSEQEWSRSNSKSECSKDLWSDCQTKTKESNDDEFLGCELLTENCVKAYS